MGSSPNLSFQWLINHSFWGTPNLMETTWNHYFFGPRLRHFCGQGLPSILREHRWSDRRTWQGIFILKDGSKHVQAIVGAGVGMSYCYIYICVCVHIRPIIWFLSINVPMYMHTLYCTRQDWSPKISHEIAVLHELGQETPPIPMWASTCRWVMVKLLVGYLLCGWNKTSNVGKTIS